MSKGLVMFLVTVLLALLAILIVIASSALLFGDEYLPNAINELILSIKGALG